MKIAIATENNDLSSGISTQGARALFFLIFGEDGNLIEILENPYASNETHVGPDVARMLNEIHVTKVVAGRFGPKFKEGLEGNQVECVEKTGFVTQAIKEFVY